MKNTVDTILQSLVKSIVFLSLLALPWINSVRISTFSYIILGVILLLKKDFFKVNYTTLRKQVFYHIFLAYYVLQVAAFFFYPEKMNNAALEQKASLIFIPLLFYILLNRYQNVWNFAKLGFISGSVLACTICLLSAINKYLLSGEVSVFFYHQYANAIGLSAIYFSVYLVIALIYTVKYLQEITSSKPLAQSILLTITATFLFFNLVLLSSKTVLFIGSLLILIMLIRQAFFSTVQKATVAIAFLMLCTGILFTNNPISNRYKELNIETYSIAFESYNFKDFAFDGLNLRLLLWRMGYEMAHENESWFTGNGGKHFHLLLNEKIKNYSLYTGDGKKNDNGYLNYNLHNQYMESFAQFGIIGVVLILTLIFSTVYYSIKYKNDILLYIILLLAFVFLTESVMETQAGILLITIFISGEWILTQQNQRLKQAS